jgi:hypothetical protein
LRQKETERGEPEGVEAEDWEVREKATQELIVTQGNGSHADGHEPT